MTKHTPEEKQQALGRVLNILDILRAKCPWDREQTYESLRTNTIEEVFELSDALLSRNMAELKKELGDVLLHVAFYAKIGEEDGVFDIVEVCDALVDKLIFRHPHIFGDKSVDNAAEVESNWEKLKQKEKGGNKTVLSGVPRSLPSMIKAYRIQDKARNVGFDWNNRTDVFAKVKEELAEVEEAFRSSEGKPSAELEAEVGDLLFSIINMSRLWGLNPDNALEATNRKFIHRFTHIEKQAKAHGVELKDLSLEEMDVWWEEAKQIPETES